VRLSDRATEPNIQIAIGVIFLIPALCSSSLATKSSTAPQPLFQSSIHLHPLSTKVMSERAASPTARSSSVYQAFSDGPHAVRSRGASAGEDQGMASETRHDFAAPLASPSSSMPAGGSASRAPGHAEAESGSIINTVWSFIPAPLLRSFYRVRNTLAIYNFFTIYCLNAMLNIEIYREYMEEHGSTTGAAKDFTHRSLAQQLYIVSLAAPLGDVLVRVLARNFLKLIWCVPKHPSASPPHCRSPPPHSTHMHSYS